MRKIKYSRAVDVLVIELSDRKIDYAEESGPFIVLQQDRRACAVRDTGCAQLPPVFPV